MSGTPLSAARIRVIGARTMRWERLYEGRVRGVERMSFGEVIS